MPMTDACRGTGGCTAAIYHDDPIYATVHRMSRGIDAGDVLLEAPLALGRPGSIDELFKVAYATPWSMIAAAVEGLAEGRLGFVEQPERELSTQWFSMHPSLMEVVRSKLDDGTFYACQERRIHQELGPHASTCPPEWWQALMQAAETPVPAGSASTPRHHRVNSATRGA